MTARSNDAGITGSPLGRLLALLGWALFAVALGYVLLFGGGYGGINFSPARTLNLQLITLGLVIWAWLAWRWPQWRPGSVIWPALLLPLAALTIATLASPFPRLGLDYVAWAVLLMALYLLLLRILAQPFVQARIGPLLALFAILLSGGYVALVVMHWLEWWQLIGRLSAPMLRPAYTGMLIGGPTVVAPVLVLLGLSAIAALGVSSTRRRVTVGVIVVVTLAAVFLSGSRAAWLALAGATLLIGVGLAAWHRERLGRLLAEPRARVSLGVAVLAVVVSGLVMAPALLDRVDRSGDGGRAVFLATAWRMFEETPLSGAGPGNWAARRIAYLEPGEPRFYVAHAHEPYVQTLAESGVMGLAAGIAALLLLLWLVISALRQGDAVRWRWAVAGLFVLVYLAISFVFDSYWNLPIMLLLAGLPFAFLDATSERGIGERLWQPDERTGGRIRAAVTVALFGTAALAVVGLARIESVASTHLRAAAAVDARDWASADELAASVVADDPGMVPYQVTRGIAAVAVGDGAAAEEAFEMAATTDDLPESWLDLALARYQQGRADETVLEAIDRARRSGDDAPGVLLAAASLYDRLGLTAEADEAYGGALAALPSLAGDPWWRSSDGVGSRFGRILELALERTTSPWELALMAGDPATARELSGEAGREAADGLAGTVIEAWSGDPDALAALQRSALEQPADRRLAAWAARASARAGDAEAARRFRRIIAFRDEGAVPPGYEWRVLDRSHDRVDGAIDLAQRYGREAYRRMTPLQLLAPGLPGLVLVDLAGATTGEE